MWNRRRDGTRSAVVALSLAFGGGWESCAQAQDNPPGPGLSSGTGVGTGAGAGAMSTANPSGFGSYGATDSGSGAMSARGPGSPMGGGRALPLGPRRGLVPYGPGVDVSFPTDPYLVPFLVPQQVGNELEGPRDGRVGNTLLEDARKIVDPAERSLALRQIANGAMASNQLALSHHILEESISASSHVTVPLVRDQRLIGLVVSLTTLSDGLLRAASENRDVLGGATDADIADVEGGAEGVRRHDPIVLIRMARLEWRRAVYLATLINNPTYRNEMLYRIAESEAVGSKRVANDLPRALDLSSLGYRAPAELARGAAGAVPPAPRPRPVRPPGPGAGAGAREDQPAALPVPPRPSAGDAELNMDILNRLADEILVDSWNVARQADRLIWKNRAMVRITLEASDSQQFRRAFELARTIENAESRAEAMLLLADAQCRRGLEEATVRVDTLSGFAGGAAMREIKRPEWTTRMYESMTAVATPTYQAAAEAVASIPQDGLRGVMTGFLVDGLIASGRFDDARACAGIYPEESERFVALGAIAEAQGRRGMANSARQWIATEAPAAYRPALYRRVVTGELWAVENERSKEYPTGGEGRTR